MCFIIVKPQGVVLANEKIQRVLEKRFSNPDGVGYAIRQGRVVRWNKGLSIPDNELSDLLSEAEVEVVLHFRAASSGPVESRMCHPFLISAARSIFKITGKLQSGEALLFHNGVLAYGHAADKLGVSDTAFLAFGLSRLLTEDPHRVRKNDWAEVRSFLAAHLTQRFVLVLPSATYVAGQWHRWEGCWISSPVEYATYTYDPRRGGAKGYEYWREKHWGLF